MQLKQFSSLFIFLITINVIAAQDNSPKLKHVGYNNVNPVFVIINARDNSTSENVYDDAETVSEEAEIMMEEAVVVAEDLTSLSDSKVQLIEYNETTGNSASLPIVKDVRDVLNYSNGKYVAINDYDNLIIADKDLYLDLKFQEDTFDNGDYKDEVIEMAERFDMVNMSFSSNGGQLYVPKYGTPKLRIYDFKAESYSEIDLTKIDDYGGKIVMPSESKDAVMFLFSRLGPYDLYKMNKTTKELQKAPFNLGGRGAFGLKYHPFENQVLFIYQDIPFAYNFDTDKFQKLNIPKESQSKKAHLESEFQRIYFSKTKNEWRHAIISDGEVVSQSINLDDSEASFQLDWADVNKIIDEEKMKNRSPKQELMAILKSATKLPKPISSETKIKIENALTDFEMKYRSKSSESELNNTLITLRLVQLDTALVSEKTVEKNKNILLGLIEKNKLNYSPITGLQVIGRIATVQPPVHPARVEVLKALVEDDLRENEITTDEQLQASGLGLLILALKANGSYDDALEYLNTQIEIILENNLFGIREAYQTKISLLLDAKRYKEAIKTIDVYLSQLDSQAAGYLDKSIKAEIYRASAYLGLKDYDRALRILNDENERFHKSIDDIFGSETKIWLEFSLLYAYVEIYYAMNAKDKNEKLNEFMTFVSENQASFQYKSIYARTLKLLELIGETNRISDLEKPR